MDPFPMRKAGLPSRPGASGTPSSAPKGVGTVDAIRRIELEREQRRRSMQERRANQEAELMSHDGPRKVGGSSVPLSKADREKAEFVRMIRAFREEYEGTEAPHCPPGEHSICVVVRKRPLNHKEMNVGDYDAVTVLNPRVVVHAPKTKVDGITRYLENSSFYFDHTFHENDSTETVYKYTVQPLVAHAFRNRGRGTCFAYGQTGSGKTHTMSGIQKYVARDVFRAIQSREFRNLDLRVYVSFYEIYGGRAFDVLHGKNPVIIRENEKQRVVAVGLKEVYVDCEKTLYDVIEAGNASRTTHSTEVNSQSSRSHAICEITVRYPPTASSIDELGDIHGSVGLIDLAGSERAADSRNHNQARRIESAEINKSLLALKECIRALAQRAANPDDPPVHVPFRASKLTLALRDSFTTSNTRVVMIAAVAPGAAAWDHTGNTLKYADRVKERPNAGGRGKADDQAVTFSFLQSDAVGSGAERRAQAAERDRESERRRGGRNVDVSPMHAEDRENGIITGAKSPPKAIFTRMGIEQQRAAAAAADGARAVVPKAQRANPRRVEAGIRSRSSSASWDENFMDVEEGDDHGNGANVGVYGNRGRGTGRRDEYSMPPDYGNLEDFLDENQRGSRHTQPRQQQQQQGNVQGLTESVLSRKSSRYSVTDDSPLPHAPHRRLSYQSEDEESDSLAEKVLVRGERKADVLHTPRSKHRGGDGAPGFSVHPPAGAAGAQSRDGRAAAAGASGGVGLRGAGGRIEQKEKEPVLENSPQRDIQLLHETLRREQPFTAAAQSGDDLLALHEAVDLIVDQEQSLLDAHMEAIQENAQLLTEEGQLLALMQGESGLEHDLSEYAEKLEALLLKKFSTTQALLAQVVQFRRNLAVEAEISKRLQDGALRVD